MDFKEINNLIEAVSNSKLTLFEVESEGIRIKMEKKIEKIVLNKSDIEIDTSTNTLLKKSIIAGNQCNTSLENSNLDNLATPKIADESLCFVIAPIVGAVYLSAGPDSNNFVNVGSKVKKGDTLCIIEAMKLMNEIESEVDGEIIEILVQNEQMVEYGQSIFKVMKQKEGK